MIHEERRPDCRNGKSTGYYPGGRYTYEKDIDITEKKTYKLEFEGSYQRTSVYLNDELIYFETNGYFGFVVDLSEKLVIGKNRIKAIVDNSGEPNTCWYSGSGLYRPVWLYEAEKEYINVDGIKVDTLSISPCVIHIKADTNAAEGTISIYDHDVLLKTVQSLDCDIEIENAKLWDCDHPNLYTIKVKTQHDEAECNYGIRTIAWSTKALFINDVSTKLRGGCIHHDNGIIRAADYPEASYRRIGILKDASFNAIRSAHNPISKSMLKARDELGMYVMDEFTDMWYDHKNRFDYATYFMDEYQNALTKWVNRDYSHPSVIMYSVGNEITETSDHLGIELMGIMADSIRKIKNNTPVTCGINMVLNLMHFAGMGTYEAGEDEILPVEDKDKNGFVIHGIKRFLKKQIAKFSAAKNPLDEAGKENSEKVDGKLVGSEYFNEQMLSMKEKQHQVCRNRIAEMLSEKSLRQIGYRRI